MDRSKKKRGISLSHQISHDQSPPHTVVSGNVRQLSFKFKPSLSSTSSPKDLRFGFQAKTKVAFNYSINQTEKQRSACSNDFTFSHLASKTPQNRLSFLKITPVNREGTNNRSSQHSSKNKAPRTQRLSLVSTPRAISGHHTQKKPYLLTKQNEMNQNRESLRQVYKRQEYERVLVQTKRDKSNSGFQGNIQQRRFPNTSSFSKIQIPQVAKAKDIRKKPISKARQSLRTSGLESLKELQIRLIQIISV